MLGIKIEQLPSRVEELFNKWKSARKAIEKNRKIDLKELNLASTAEFKGNVLDKVSEILKTQPEHIPKTIKRFLTELEDIKIKLK